MSDDVRDALEAARAQPGEVREALDVSRPEDVREAIAAGGHERAWMVDYQFAADLPCGGQHRGSAGTWRVGDPDPVVTCRWPGCRGRFDLAPLVAVALRSDEQVNRFIHCDGSEEPFHGASVNLLRRVGP